MSPRTSGGGDQSQHNLPYTCFSFLREDNTGNHPALWATKLIKSCSFWVCVSSLIASADLGFSCGWHTYKALFLWSFFQVVWLYFHEIWKNFIGRSTWVQKLFAGTPGYHIPICLTSLGSQTKNPRAYFFTIHTESVGFAFLCFSFYTRGKKKKKEQTRRKPSKYRKVWAPKKQNHVCYYAEWCWEFCFDSV